MNKGNSHEKNVVVFSAFKKKKRIGVFAEELSYVTLKRSSGNHLCNDPLKNVYPYIFPENCFTKFIIFTVIFWYESIIWLLYNKFQNES